MTLEINTSYIPPKNWNDDLKLSSHSTVYHTIEYAIYAKKFLNWNPIFFSIYNSKGKLVSKLLGFELRRNLKGLPISNLFFNLSNKFKILKWLLGPLIFDNDLTENIISEFLKYVNKHYSKFNGSFHPLIKYDFSQFPQFTNWGTYLIDLQQSKELIKSQFDKRSVIKNIKRSNDRGVIISQINQKNIIDYAKLLNEFRQINQLTKYPVEQTIELWNILKPTGFSGFIAYYNNRAIGGLTFSSFNGYINEWGVARSKIDTEHKLYSQDYIKSKIIEWGIDNNQRYYDLTGFNPNPVSLKEKGILRYKRKWGGKQYNLFYYNN